MMKLKMITAICLTLVLSALSGCQLAKESLGANGDRDRLIGVFVTTEHLDLFDTEAYLNDSNISIKNGEASFNGADSQKYQGRLYANLVARTDTDEETGLPLPTYEYVFEGIEGVQYCAPFIQLNEEEDGYNAPMSDPAVSDVQTGFFIYDDENSMSLEGTIYIVPSGKNNTYFFNPVYQSADGSVYTVTNYGVTFGTDTESEGSIYTQTIDETTTITENGKVKKDSTSIKVSLSVIFVPEKIAILQMGPDNALISRKEYKPGEMPEELELEKGSAYFIVETHKRDDAGAAMIHREIYGEDTESIETFFVKAEGICSKHSTRII